MDRIFFFVFGSSWTAFFFAGKWFFETGLGQFHAATASRELAWLCKLIFLATFVTACNLMLLLAFEILDLLHPTLRQLAWSLSLSTLCVLLNLLIPVVFATSVASTVLGIRKTKAFLSGVAWVITFQLTTWSVWGILSLFNLVPMRVSFLSFLFRQLFLVDLQTSVAHIALSGTATAAIIAGFSTVSFPLEQIMVLRGVDSSLLRLRERKLAETCALISELKRRSLRQRCRYRENCTAKTLHAEYSSFLPPRMMNIWTWSKTFFLSWAHNFAIGYDRNYSYSNMQFTFHTESSTFSPAKNTNTQELDNNALFAEMTALEKLCESIYLDIVNLSELQAQSEFTRTPMGRIVRFLGHALSIIAILRLIVGLWHVAGFVLGDSFEGVSSQPDLIVSAVSLIVVYMRIQIDAVSWSPMLNFCLISVLAVIQIRGFLGTTQQLARLGFLSTSTEHYALALAFLAGNYFIASVVLLRTQLPLRYRRGITIALGDDFQFEFFFWLFDFLFVFSSLFSALFLWLEQAKTQQVTNERKKIEIE